MPAQPSGCGTEVGAASAGGLGRAKWRRGNRTLSRCSEPLRGEKSQRGLSHAAMHTGSLSLRALSYAPTKTCSLKEKGGGEVVTEGRGQDKRVPPPGNPGGGLCQRALLKSSARTGTPRTPTDRRCATNGPRRLAPATLHDGKGRNCPDRRRPCRCGRPRTGDRPACESVGWARPRLESPF